MRERAAWRGHCFGLTVESAIAIEGCACSSTGEWRPAVRIDVDSGSGVRVRLGGESEVIARIQDGSGRWRGHVRAHPARGYLLTPPRLGAYHVDASGEHVVAAPPRMPAWRWQRGLIGEVLPFVAAVRGFETLHASGVVLPGGESAIAICGGSGSGKTSIAADLVLAGATFLADDVVSLDVRAGQVIAHPGVGLMSVRSVTVARLGDQALGRLGTTVGADARGARLAVRRHELPVPLSALYLLEPDADGRDLTLERLPAPDPPTLLGRTFNFVLQTPLRLLAQLDVIAAMSTGVRVVQVRLPTGGDHAAAARRILADARAGT